MKVGSLFSGIGGFDLGLERAGFEIAWQVEIDPFCQKVLAKHWPNVMRYGDIKNVANLEPVDLICGGFPCQPFSCAGKRRGAEDDRYLWPEMFRIIQETKPTWIIGENVTGFISMGLDNCVSDLEGAGYEVQPLIIPACAVGAPHRRDRVWVIAHTIGGQDHSAKPGRLHAEPGCKDSGTSSDAADSEGFGGRPSLRQNGSKQNGHQPADGAWTGSNSSSQGLEGGKRSRSHDSPATAHGSTAKRRHTWTEPWPEVAARLCRVDNGLPRRMDRTKRLRALGNAIVPQIAEIVGRAIKEIENRNAA